MPVGKGQSSENLCRAIFERNQDTISIRKPEVAVRNLTSIIEAALKLSNQKGFQAMSLRDLSKEADLSMGGLYAYFDSKTTLLNMILGQVTASVEEVLGTPPKEVTHDPVEHLKWLIDTHIRLTDTMLPWFAFSFMEAKNFPRRERRMAIDSEALTEHYFEEVITRAKTQNRLRPGVTPLLPMLIKPLLQDWYVKRAKYRRRKVSVNAYIATVQEFVLNASLPVDQLTQSSNAT